MLSVHSYSLTYTGLPTCGDAALYSGFSIMYFVTPVGIGSGTMQSGLMQCVESSDTVKGDGIMRESRLLTTTMLLYCLMCVLCLCITLSLHGGSKVITHNNCAWKKSLGIRLMFMYILCLYGHSVL